MKDTYVAYVGTYTREDDIGIHIFDVDVEKGEFHERGSVDLDNPSHLTISHNGKYLYCTSDKGATAFAIQADGSLMQLNQVWTGGMRGCDLETDAEDKYLIIAGYYDGRVTVMHLNEDGSIGGVADGVFHKGVGKSINRRNTSPHVNCVMLTPDQKYLCAVDNGLDCVKVYKFHHDTGKIDMVDMIHLPMEAAPRHMVFSQDGRYLYIVCELMSVIEVYEYHDTEKGPYFNSIQTISSKGPKDHGNSAGSDLIFSPDGKYLLCSNAGINMVSIYDVDQETGMLNFRGSGAINGEYPKTLAIFPDGKHFISLNYDSNEMSFFHFNEDMTGFLNSAKPVKIIDPNSISFYKL